MLEPLFNYSDKVGDFDAGTRSYFYDYKIGTKSK